MQTLPLYFVFAVTAHAVLCRVSSLGSLPSFVLTGVTSGLILLFRAPWTNDLVGAAAGICLYALACELYIFLFTMVSSSISASLLLTMRRGPARCTDLERAYSSEGMVKRRLEKLVNSGLLIHEGNRFFVTAKGARLARTFRALRFFFGHEVQEPKRSAQTG